MNRQIGYIINESAIPGFTETNIVAEDKKGRVVAEAIVQIADEVNRNKRIYPEEELFPQLTCPRTMELLEAGRLFGECGHPLSTDLVRQQTIDQGRASVLWLKFWTEGKTVYGRYRPSNNAFGDALNEDLKDGCKPAFSLRALGTIQQTPRGAEVHNLRLISYDEVVFPSHPSAYTQRVISLGESGTFVNWYDESGVEKTDRIEVKKTNIQRLYEQEARKNKESNKQIEVVKEGVLIPITNQSVVDYICAESSNIKLVTEMFDFAYDNIGLIDNGRRVKLSSKDGITMVINLEQQIHNEIMNYCTEIYNR